VNGENGFYESEKDDCIKIAKRFAFSCFSGYTRSSQFFLLFYSHQ
jgi:hypothetical protein